MPDEEHEPEGLDLHIYRPDYTKSKEENKKLRLKKYREAFGEDPPWWDGEDSRD